MPFNIPFAQWLFARKTFDKELHDPFEAKLTKVEQELIKKALQAQDEKKELKLTEKQKEKMEKAFEKLYIYFRHKRAPRKTMRRKSIEYYEENIYWDDRKPKRGVERHEMMETCGSKCFLLPKEEKFPICERCGKDVCFCEPHCAGLLSAYRRARQLESRIPERKDKYGKVAKRAHTLAIKQKCGWVQKKK